MSLLSLYTKLFFFSRLARGVHMCNAVPELCKISADVERFGIKVTIFVK